MKNLVKKVALILLKICSDKFQNKKFCDILENSRFFLKKFKKVKKITIFRIFFMGMKFNIKFENWKKFTIDFLVKKNCMVISLRSDQ